MDGIEKEKGTVIRISHQTATCSCAAAISSRAVDCCGNVSYKGFTGHVKFKISQNGYEPTKQNQVPPNKQNVKKTIYNLYKRNK